jgi:predicted transcriptional regulator
MRFLTMTKLLEQAIEKVRELPEADQNLAADLLFALAAKRSPPEELDEETLAAINEGLAQADRGEFVSDEEMAEFFRRRGA